MHKHLDEYTAHTKSKDTRAADDELSRMDSLVKKTSETSQTKNYSDAGL
jgi:hypothetical protein